MTDIEVLDGSPAAPPRDNGELVFEAPWQSRAFGVAADLVDSGHFTWNDFREYLIEAIVEWETLESSGQQSWDYYSCWVTALEQILKSRELLEGDEFETRATHYASRPHGHDH
tara:strand:+ start:1883 stop:2221 length:339 start_codon:yes stop_codon:yes gene_type:complete